LSTPECITPFAVHHCRNCGDRIIVSTMNVLGGSSRYRRSDARHAEPSPIGPAQLFPSAFCRFCPSRHFLHLKYNPRLLRQISRCSREAQSREFSLIFHDAREPYGGVIKRTGTAEGPFP